MLRKWSFILLLTALGAFGLVACDAPVPVQTADPANTPGAVTLPALHTGGHAAVVYFIPALPVSIERADFTAVLRRYDPDTRQSTDVLKLSDERIEEAQISADGQWILYVAYVEDHDELRVVRLDGRYAQTLLKAPLYVGLSNVQWSPDQKSIIFAEQPPQTGPRVIYLLDLARRHLQVELTSASQPGAPQYVPREWLDNTRVLVTDVASPLQSYIVQDSPFLHLAVLDTARGPGQQPASMQAVYSTDNQCGDFDASADATQIFLLSCHIGSNLTGSSTISVRSLSGGTAHSIFQSATLIISQLRRLTPQTLLLIGNQAVWSIHSDGTGLKRLFDMSHNVSMGFCRFSRSAWSNISRDRSMYALEEIEMGTDTHVSLLNIGFSGGGEPQKIVESSVGILGNNGGADIGLVGWTTL